MIKGKYGKADLTPATRFQVKYLGSGMTEGPGMAGIENAVRKIQEQAKDDDKAWPKMLLEVEGDGVKFTEMKTKSTMKESKFISLENISYCTLNRLDATIFAFNHHKSPSVVECHAVACESGEKAKSIGLALYAAFREGHFQKLRRERRKSLEQKHVERRASFDHYERNSCDITPTETFSSNFANPAPNSTKDICHFVESPHDELSIENIDYEEELELDKIIEDLLSTVEIEKAKIEQGVEWNKINIKEDNCDVSFWCPFILLYDNVQDNITRNLIVSVFEGEFCNF